MLSRAPLVRCAGLFVRLPDPRRQRAGHLAEHDPAARRHRDHRLGGDGRGRGAAGAAARQLLLIAMLAIAVVAHPADTLAALRLDDLGPRQRDCRRLPRARHAGSARAPVADARGDARLASRVIPSLAIVLRDGALRAYRPHVAGGRAHCRNAGRDRARRNAGRQLQRRRFALVPLCETNVGRAVGFFANADHMATLLVMTMPFLAAIVAAGRSASMQRYSAIIAVAAGLAIVILVGLALNGSLAGYGLALPVIAASVLIILPPASRLRLWVVALAALLLVASEPRSKHADRSAPGSASMRRARCSRAPTSYRRPRAPPPTSCRSARASARSEASIRSMSSRSR